MCGFLLILLTETSPPQALTWALTPCSQETEPDTIFLTQPTLRATKALLYPRSVFRRSSAVEQLTVNQLVVGSIPTAGAKEFKGLAGIAEPFFHFSGTSFPRF